MKEFSASYNFPNGFLWGSLPEDPVFTSGSSGNPARKLKDANQNAAVINIPWNDLCTGQNSFDENRIESIRYILARLRTMNIETLVFLDSSVIPEHFSTKKINSEDLQNAYYHFAVHIIDAILPYTQFLSVLKLYPSGIFQKDVQKKLFLDLREHVKGASDKTKVGITIDYAAAKPSGFITMFTRRNRAYKDIAESEFTLLIIDGPVSDNIRFISVPDRKPVMTLNHYYGNLPEEQKKYALLDDIFELWQCYQKGTNTGGYFPAITSNNTDRLNDFYSSVCKENALKISTEYPDLPEKWIRFLKD